MDIIDRISEICSDKKIKPAYLHKHGVAASQTVYDVLKKKQKPGIEFISKFLELFPDVNGNWLMKGKGKKYIASGESNNKQTGNEGIKYSDSVNDLESVNEESGEYTPNAEDLKKRIIELEAKLEEKENFIKQLLEQLKK